MGKKRKFQNKKIIIDSQQFYTENERNKMITAFMFKLMEANMSHILTNDIRTNIFEFIKKGVPYSTELNLPEYGNILEIQLNNDKNKENSINFKTIDKIP